MKITIEHYDNKITHEVNHEDVSLEKMLEIIEGILLASGYRFTGSLEIVDEWNYNEDVDISEHLDK